MRYTFDVSRTPRALLLTLTLLFWLAAAWSAIRPYNWHDYWLEMATPLALFAILAATVGRFPFTRIAYVLMFFEAVVLIIGAHYTHAKVPLFEWIREPLHLSRNHYDRFAHFFVGLSMVIPLREILRRTSPLRGAWLEAMSVVGILAWAGFYEIFEWWVAITTSPETGAAYLGTQGDEFDAQKDMLLDTIGGIAGVALFRGAHDRQMNVQAATRPDA